MSETFESYILRFDSNVLKRFESNVGEGTLFLYNVKTQEFWCGNESAFRILNMLDGINTVERIYYIFHKLHSEIDISDIKSSIDMLFKDLLQKKFLVKNDPHLAEYF